MKRLSISLPIIILLLTLTGAGFTRKQAASVPAAAQTLYYWYTYPDDSYNDRKTIDDETYEMWLYYGVFVNTNPAGGTLIDRGYTNNAYPHTVFPSVYLYAHY
jgi:hypothetical protein